MDKNSWAVGVLRFIGLNIRGIGKSVSLKQIALKAFAEISVHYLDFED